MRLESDAAGLPSQLLSWSWSELATFNRCFSMVYIVWELVQMHYVNNWSH